MSTPLNAKLPGLHYPGPVALGENRPTRCWRRPPRTGALRQLARLLDLACGLRSGAPVLAFMFNSKMNLPLSMSAKSIMDDVGHEDLQRDTVRA